MPSIMRMALMNDDRYLAPVKVPPPPPLIRLLPRAPYLHHHSISFGLAHVAPAPHHSMFLIAGLPPPRPPLQDPPLKKGFKLAHVAPAPYSMFLTEPHVEAGPGGVGLRDTKVGTKGGIGIWASGRRGPTLHQSR